MYIVHGAGFSIIWGPYANDLDQLITINITSMKDINNSRVLLYLFPMLGGNKLQLKNIIF